MNKYNGYAIAADATLKAIKTEQGFQCTLKYLSHMLENMLAQSLDTLNETPDEDAVKVNLILEAKSY